MSTDRRAKELWKRRAKNALGNRRSDFHFPTAPTTTNSYLTIVITFYKIQLPASLRSDC
jgi:hypothetical protein